jgi:putative ABC transport system permease protein
MDRLDGLIARARSLIGYRAADRRMNEEFRFHLEMETQKLIDLGVAPDEAYRRALIAFGGVDRQREEMRDGRGLRWLRDFGADVRYALRMLRRGPVLGITAAITIGLGVGLNGVVVSVVNGLLFRPLPVADPDRIVALFELNRRGDARSLGYQDYVDYRDRSSAFAGVAVHTGTPLNLEVGSRAEMVWGEMVSENYFGVLAMQPTLGRFFTAAESKPGAYPLAVVSYASWRERFHGDTTVIGRVVRINGSPFTIVGVAAKGFRGMRMFGFWPEIWAPLGMHDVLQPGSGQLFHGRGPGSLTAFGRMRPGWTLDRTKQAAALFARQLAQAFPETNKDVGTIVFSASAGAENPTYVPPKLLVLSTALGTFGVTLVLVVICANLANLLLARTAAREHELAIRLSLGCSRARLVRQLLVEAAVLALPGVLVGIALPFATPAIQEPMLPRLQFRVGFDVTPDWRVVVYTAGVALLAVLLFGLSPALRASRRALVSSLKAVVIRARGRPTGSRGSGMRAALVVVQLALSVVLLVGGALFVRSLSAARAIDAGFDSHDRVVISVNPGLQRYDEARGRTFYREVVERVASLPGVAAAGWGFPVPFDSYGRAVRLHVDGMPTTSADQMVGVSASTVDVGFFDALGLRIVSGRAFAAGDTAGTPTRMIVSRAVGAKFWPGRDPIGQRARLGSVDGPEITVIGVTDDAFFSSKGSVVEEHVFLALRQNYRDWQTLVVHAGGQPEQTIRRIEQVIAAVDPALPTFGAMTMDESIASSLNGAENAAAFASIFGLLALVIAATGLYALVANGVTERTREIGVRVALGATPASVLRLVIGRTARLAAVGLLLGLASAAVVARLLGSLLYGISAYDAPTFAAVPILLAVVVLVASYLPARRATMLDAAVALRE